MLFQLLEVIRPADQGDPGTGMGNREWVVDKVVDSGFTGEGTCVKFVFYFIFSGDPRILEFV